MANHYETLGVEEGATADQIKRAYRSKAKAHHPDKGGDRSEFDPVVRAYEILSNPERRQLYDATGDDKKPSPIEVEVQNVLLQRFNQALERDAEFIAYTREQMQATIKAAREKKKELKAVKKKLTAKRGTVTTTGPVNLVHLLIDKQLAELEQGVKHFDHTVEIAEACLVALDAYSEEVEKPEPQMYIANITLRFG